MADKSKPGSLLGKRPKADIGQTFAAIKGEAITITAIEWDRDRTGKDGEAYDLVILTLDGDPPMKVHTGSKPIVEYFEKIDPDADLPATATFDLVDSASNKGRSYWDIVA